jgi:hypothetical protein
MHRSVLLGQVWAAAGRLEDAEAGLEEALAIRRRRYGNESVGVLAALRGLLNVLSAGGIGFTARAVEVVGEMLATEERMKWEDSQEVEVLRVAQKSLPALLGVETPLLRLLDDMARQGPMSREARSLDFSTIPLEARHVGDK